MLKMSSAGNFRGALRVNYATFLGKCAMYM